MIIPFLIISKLDEFIYKVLLQKLLLYIRSIENNTKSITFFCFHFSTSCALQIIYTKICIFRKSVILYDLLRGGIISALNNFGEACRAPGRVLHNCTHGWKFIDGQARRREACWKSELKGASWMSQSPSF